MGDSIKNEAPKSGQEASGDEIFKRMVIQDKKQNQFLKNKLTKGSSGSYGVNDSKSKGEKSSGMRFVVVTLGVMSLAMSQLSRGVINYCITSMVDPRMLRKVPDSLPVTTSIPELPISVTTMSESFNETVTTIRPQVISWAETATATTTGNMDMTTITDATSTLDSVTTAPTIAETTTTYLETTTAYLKTTTAYPETTTTYPDQPITMDPDGPIEDKFMWTIKEQSLVKGGFFYSYFFFMILGGRMSEIYGAKYVLLLGVAGSALINLATPWMARNSLAMLIVSRIIMGAIQSGVFPAMYALINKWLTMSEASIYAPMIKMSLRLGQLLSSLVPGLIHDWPGAFYVVGGLATVWSILWMIISTSEPATNRWVTKTELAHIMKKKRKTREPEEEDKGGIDMTIITSKSGSNESNGAIMANGAIKIEHTNGARPPKVATKKTPWIKIITSPSVIGLILVKLSFNFCSDFLTVELPSYLKYVHDASRQRISAITTGMFAIQVSLIIFAGWLAKVMIKRRPLNVSKTGVRKLFQSVSNLGGGMFLFMITIGNCGLSEATILLQLISIASVFTAGGETMIPYDLSDEYPATIMAIANSVANLSGVTVTTLTGFILGDQGGSQSRWNTVIGLIAGAEMLGGLAFLFLVKAEPINFESKLKANDIEENPRSSPPPPLTHESNEAELAPEEEPTKESYKDNGMDGAQNGTTASSEENHEKSGN